MAQNEFNGTGTHLEARNTWNANASDAETRLAEIEKPNYLFRQTGPFGPLSTTDTWLTVDTFSTTPNPQLGLYAFDYNIIWSSSSANGNRDLSIRYRFEDGVNVYDTDEFTTEPQGDSSNKYVLPGFGDIGITGPLVLTIKLQIKFSRASISIDKHVFRFLRVSEAGTDAAGALSGT